MNYHLDQPIYDSGIRFYKRLKSIEPLIADYAVVHQRLWSYLVNMHLKFNLIEKFINACRYLDDFESLKMNSSLKILPIFIKGKLSLEKKIITYLS